jgi:hypothetical protein
VRAVRAGSRCLLSRCVSQGEETDTGGSQYLSSHFRERQRMGGLGKELVHPHRASLTTEPFGSARAKCVRKSCPLGMSGVYGAWFVKPSASRGQRARCMPDQAVNAGNSRSFPDSRYPASPADRQLDTLRKTTF